MPVKKIVFYIMCGLLVTMLIISCITISKANVLVQGILHPAPPATDPPSTIVDTTEPDNTTPPTSLPVSTEGTIDPNHEHSYSVYKTSAATCTEEGYTLYKCSCGDTEIRDEKSALGHSFGAGKVVSSCTEENYTKFECSVCKFVEKRDVTPAPGHKFDQGKTYPATCTEDAYTVRKCTNSNCNETETVTKPNTALGHNYKVKEEVAASCYQDGYKISECTNEGCADKPIKEIIPATNVHDFGDWTDGNTCNNPGCTVVLLKKYVGNTCVIEIWMSSAHKLYSYTIVDERSDSNKALYPLSFKFVEEEGLVVTYNDQTKPLGFENNNLTIAENDAPTEPPTEAPTESSTEGIDPTEPTT